MKQIDQYDFYKMGNELAVVARLKEGGNGLLASGTGPSRGELFGAVAQLARWTRNLQSGNPIKLLHSGASLNALSAFNNELMEKYYSSDKWAEEWSSPVQPWEVARLKNLFRAFETNLAAELGRAATYFVPQRGIYDVNDLIAFAEKQFSAELLSKMPHQAILDYRDAGKCIAFDLTTAAGLHAARALERVLARYAESFGVPECDEKDMGECLKALDDYLAANKSAPRLPKAHLIEQIRRIKNVDRNALMHPKKNLDQDDAIRVFNDVTGTIIAMLKEIPDLAPPGEANISGLTAVTDLADEGISDGSLSNSMALSVPTA